MTDPGEAQDIRWRVLEAAPAMLSFWDCDLRCRFANRAFERWFGADASSLIGMTLGQLLGPETFAQKEPLVRAALQGVAQSFECVVSHPNGTKRQGLAHYVPERSGEEVIGFTIQVADISELHETRMHLLAERERWIEASQRLRRNEEALREAQRLGNIGSWEWEVEPDIVWWSDQLYQIFGRDPRLLPPSYAEHGELYTPQSWARLQRVVSRLLAEGEPFKVDLEYRRPDGSTGWIEGRGAAERDAAGRITRLYGTSLEITHHRLPQLLAKRRKRIVALQRNLQQEREGRQRLEAALAQSRKLETLGMLAGGIAHDFNNVLAAVLGSLQLLKRRGLDAGAADLVGRGLKAVDRAARIVRQLMSFARVQQTAIHPVDLGELVVATRELLQLTTGSRISVSVEVADTGYAMVDRAQLETALLNLAVNARDSMPQGGSLRVTLKRAPIGTDPRQWLHVAIADSGCGMDAVTLAKAREPFFTTKGRQAGTGLGLAMVSAFAEAAGGMLQLESTVGVGTVATLSFPEVDAGATPASTSGGEEVIDFSGHGDATILVVDDDELVRATIEQYLVELGYTVHAVTCGADALSYVHSLRPVDLVVSDVAMPGMDGRTLVGELAQVRPGLRSLMMSGSPEAVRSESALLEKPFSQASLAARVLEVLGRRDDRRRASVAAAQHPDILALLKCWFARGEGPFTLEHLAVLEAQGKVNLSAGFVDEVAGKDPLVVRKLHSGVCLDERANRMFNFELAVNEDGRLVANDRSGYQRCIAAQEPVYERLMVTSESNKPVLCERILLPCGAPGATRQYVVGMVRAVNASDAAGRATPAPLASPQR